MATGGYDVNQTERPIRYDRSMLYLNEGTGHFVRAEDSPLANADDPASGSTWGDMDGDRDLDGFVNTEHGRPNVFYRNQGGGRFAREQLGDATSTPGSNFRRAGSTSTVTATWTSSSAARPSSPVSRTSSSGTRTVGSFA